MTDLSQELLKLLESLGSGFVLVCVLLLLIPLVIGVFDRYGRPKSTRDEESP